MRFRIGAVVSCDASPDEPGFALSLVAELTGKFILREGADKLTGVPDRNLGFKAFDSFTICSGECLVRFILNHKVL